VVRLLRNKQGSAPAVALVVIAPLLMVVCLGFSWFGQVAAIKGVCEEAARSVAREMSVKPEETDLQHFKTEGCKVITQASNNSFMPKDTGHGGSAQIVIEFADDERSMGLPLRNDGYAYCRVTYNYPVPLSSFWAKMIDLGVWDGTGAVFPIVGEAFFEVVEGDI
jgi:hypothetical protein